MVGPVNYGAKFDKDLRFGEAREDAFVHVLLRSRVEHKRDRKCAFTGNVAVEYEQRFADGDIRPSGIAVSRAGFYAIEYDAEHWLLLPLEALKELAREAIRQERDRWIGDGENHHNALIPFEWFDPTSDRQAPVALRAVG